MRYSSAAATAALAATLALLACTSNPPASPTPTPEASPTPEAPATAEPTRTVAPFPGQTTTPTPPDVGILVLEASGVGEHYAVYDGHSRLLDDDLPRFTAGGAVWYSPVDQPGAFRWDPASSATETIGGAWGVIESDDGLTRAYYLRGEDGPTSELAAARGGLTLSASGDHRAHVLSPDGLSLAVYRWENDANSLVVFDLASGLGRTLATGIEACACDRDPPPSWSPAGAYLAYTDSGALTADDDDRGSFVVAAAGDGDAIEVGDVRVGWLATASGDRLVGLVSGVLTLVDPATGESAARALPGLYVRSAVLTTGGKLLDVAVNDSDGVARTLLVDPLTSEILGSWVGGGTATMTPDGPAFASTSTEGCAGTRLDHPALDAPRCFEGADAAFWSPDGRLLALRGDSRQSTDDWVEIWGVPADARYHFDTPPDSRMVEWSRDSVHLLVTWGVGI